MEIKNFIMVFAIIGLVVTVISLFYSNLANNYNYSSYDEADLAVYEKLDELQNISSSINESLSTVEQGNPIDVVGGLLSSGYTVLKTTWASFDVYVNITEEATEKANLGPATNIFKNTALILGFLAFMFAMISILTGRTKT